MDQNHATLVQSLVDSGILSKEDATLFSRLDTSDPESVTTAPASDSGTQVLEKLKEIGRLSPFQIQVLERDGPNDLLLGDYILIDRLGSGGMGEVYRAVHRIMRREVAIKRIKTSHLSAPGLADRFIREVRTAAKLVHPNIVTAYDAGEVASGCYLVMEYVQGQDLAQLIREQGPLPVPRAVELLLQAARALAHAHQAGIIHRDVKPANFLIDQAGTLKLLDLGLSRTEQTIAQVTQSADLTLTHADQIVGTLAYLAPEQAEDPHAASTASDLYSLGCTFCHMVLGRPPFQVKSMTQALIAHREKPPPDLSAELPGPLHELYQSLMAKNPLDRPASAEQVVHDLEQMIASGELGKPSPPPAVTSRSSRTPRQTVRTTVHAAASAAHHRPRPKWLVPVSIASGVLILGLVIALVVSSMKQPAPDPLSAPTNDNTTAIPNSNTSASKPPVTDGGAKVVTADLPDILNTTQAASNLQVAQAQQRGHPVEIPNKLGMKLRYIPAASYRRGSTSEQVEWAMEQAKAEGLIDRYAQYIESEKPQKLVSISQPFYLATTEVTVGQFRAFVAATDYKTVAETNGTGGNNFATGDTERDANWSNPGMQQDDSHPVVNITQADAIAFCEWLSKEERRLYRLPRDSEWEYACRSGSTGRWCFGDDPSTFYQYGWCYNNSPNSTKPVAKLKPNAFGLYDMHGNAREWVLLDDGTPSDRYAIGIVRGGSFTKPQVLVRSASRVGFKVNSPYAYHGFRVLLEIKQDSQPKLNP